MATTIKSSKSNPSKNQFGLSVTLEDSKNVRISSGAFKLEGQSLSFGTDVVKTLVGDPSDPVKVEGFVVVNGSTPSIEVHESILGAETRFVPSAGKACHRLFQMVLPANPGDVTGEALTVWHLVSNQA
jgi:hypothetical protein